MKRLSRRGFLATASALSAPLVYGRTSHAAVPPNLVYVFSDEHRWQSMGHTEMPAVRTPNLLRLGQEGIEFTHCISNYPVCSPYRAMLQTGKWPFRQGVLDNKLPLSPKQPTFGTLFRDAGYRTCYIGKWHLGGTRAEPFGWEHSLVWTGDGDHRRATYHPAEGAPVTAEGYTVDLKTDQLIEFINAHHNRPFCAAISYNAPHANFSDAPDDLNALYPNGSLPWRPNAKREEANGNGGAFRFSETEYTGYHAHITGVDRALGRIMQRLEELAIADNTILVYTSDHGSMFGSHGVGSKRQPYEESIRVPFMCRWPKVIHAGRRSEALFGTIDILPTLCHLAGIRPPDEMDGLDFSPWFRGEAGPDPEHQFIMHISKLNASHGNNHPAPIFRGVRTKTHTYAAIEDGKVWLFDNSADPYQLTNLQGHKEAASIEAACCEATKAWLKAANDPYRHGAFVV